MKWLFASNVLYVWREFMKYRLQACIHSVCLFFSTLLWFWFAGLVFQIQNLFSLICNAIGTSLGAIHSLRKGPEGGGIGKISTYSYFGRGEAQTHSYVIFSKSLFYIRNRAVKWFGKDHISFTSGR